jgi:GNAT superfamily N-acetyltransferase
MVGGPCRMEATVELPAGYRLSVEREPSNQDRRALSDGLEAYNEPFLPNADPHSLAVLLRDPGSELRAGLDGFTYAGWLFIRYLWVHADLRRGGIGRRLMAEAEAHARALGCHSVWVDTFTFQAPAFYAKLGYREFGRLDYPPGHQRIFLQKQLLVE